MQSNFLQKGKKFYNGNKTEREMKKKFRKKENAQRKGKTKKRK